MCGLTENINTARNEWKREMKKEKNESERNAKVEPIRMTQRKSDRRRNWLWWKACERACSFSWIRIELELWTLHISVKRLLHRKLNTLYKFVDGSNGFCCCAVINFVSSLAPIVKSFFHHLFESLLHTHAIENVLVLFWRFFLLWLFWLFMGFLFVAMFFYAVGSISSVRLRNFFFAFIVSQTKEAPHRLWLSGRMNETWFMKWKREKKHFHSSPFECWFHGIGTMNFHWI